MKKTCKWRPKRKPLLKRTCLCGMQFTTRKTNKFYHTERCQDLFKKRAQRRASREALLEKHGNKCWFGGCWFERYAAEQRWLRQWWIEERSGNEQRPVVTLYRHEVEGEEVMLCAYHRAPLLLDPPQPILANAPDLWNVDAATVRAVNEQMGIAAGEGATDPWDSPCWQAWNRVQWASGDKLVTDGAIRAAERNGWLYETISEPLRKKHDRTYSLLDRERSLWVDGGFDALIDHLSGGKSEHPLAWLHEEAAELRRLVLRRPTKVTWDEVMGLMLEDESADKAA